MPVLVLFFMLVLGLSKRIEKDCSQQKLCDDILGNYHSILEINPMPQDSIKSLMLPDSLDLILDSYLQADFNGDELLDFAAKVRHKQNQQIGVIIIHLGQDIPNYVFGAGAEVDGMTNLDWIEEFRLLPKGELIAPTLVDRNTGDIIGPDHERSFKLLGNGIFMGVAESHGGGILFWNGVNYEWFHIE